jgi:excisionase family DNA binding protein
LQKTPKQWAPEYISVGFIAKHCGVSNTTVLRWINTGQLPAFKLPGGHFRIERTDFSRFLKRYNMPVRNPYIEPEP